MVNEPTNGLAPQTAQVPNSAREPVAAGNSTLWRRTRLLGAALVCGLVIGSAVYFLRPVDVNGQAGITPGKDSGKSPGHFLGWVGVPDLAIVVSGQMHGHIQPCGCSDPQFGGLTRRYNFIQSLRDKSWPIVALDVGEIAQSHGPQSVLKYEYSMKALREMGYSAMGIGRNECNMPLWKALGEYAQNNDVPAMLATNLEDKNGDFKQLNFQRFKIINVRPQLGIFSVVDSVVEREIKDKDCKFISSPTGLANVLLQNHAQVNILIYQGTDSNAEVGKFIAELDALRLKNPKIPQVPIILSLSSDPEPPARARIIGNTTIVSVGWKGRYVGVIGLFANAGRGYALKYELVPMGKEYETPDNPAVIANHPLMKLMEDYTRRVRDGKYIEKFPRGPHPLQVEAKANGQEAHYVGNNEKKCAGCHDDAIKIWQGSHHSHAFATLEHKAKNPSLRQFDGECVVCHTTGFQHAGGYMSPGNTPQQNEKLQNVSCENCHGPASAHLKNNNDKKIHALMNPYSTTRRIPEKNNTPALVEAWKTAQFRKQDDFCQKCHDQENDVNWGKHAFKDSWAKIKHYKNELAPVIEIQPGPVPLGPPLTAPPGTGSQAVPPTVQPPTFGPPRAAEIKPGDKK